MIRAFVLSLLLLPGVWAADLPRPEHPRPDFERPLWQSLNGTWQFEVDSDNTGEGRGLTSGHDLRGQIVVPFCPESKLSGVAHTDFMTHVWYRRVFDLPAGMEGHRVLLHFGAVDWEARVWLNGVYLGSHRGGYTPFSFDATAALRPTGNELVVQANDDTRSGLQATGKQSHKRESYGCVYTRTTGIWQTVWLEAAGETWLREFSATPDQGSGRVFLQATTAGPSAGCRLRVQALTEGRVVAEDTVPCAGRATTALLTIPNPILWEPGKPFLYDLRLTILKGDRSLDEVRSYVGLRSIRIDGNRMLINNRPVFQRLVLDQGFYPEGIYTAPTDADLRRDIELSMAAGFNGARLHQKVFEPRLLYWADRLGYMVWGEYPSWGVNLGNPAAMAQVAVEWNEVLRRDRNHPCIIGWCPLNETGADEAAAQAQQILSATQLIDPSRPFLDTSGYVHYWPDTDVYDCHDYNQNPSSFASRYQLFSLTGAEAWNNNPKDERSRYRGQPYFVSEYGGTRLQVEAGQGAAWGYGAAAASVQEFLARYKGLTDALLDNPNMCGFCYTQLTDIEQEQNGVYFYDRQPKYDPALLRAINARPAAYETQPPRLGALRLLELVPTSQARAQTWRFTLDKPTDDWFEPGFDDSGWREGPGGFGTASTPGAVVGTVWNTKDIWLRRSFEADPQGGGAAFLKIHHDEDAEVYLNGKLMARLTGYTTDYTLADVTRELAGALKPGVNTLAVHCHQEVGGQFIDVGISVQH